jgi:putative transposase
MNKRKVEWSFFDPEVDLIESVRNLPHRDQTGALTFVTFRLADSMPNHIVAGWHRDIEHWLQERGLGGKSVDDVLDSTDVACSVKKELRKFKYSQWHGHLDDCHGDCLLRKPALAAEIGKSLLHFDDERYDVERFIIMPNHVHVLIQMRSSYDLRKQFREIQRYSARQINRLIERSGELWQGEPFDHIVRSEEQFLYLQKYIRDNPVKGRVPEGEYLYWEFEMPGIK